MKKLISILVAEDEEDQCILIQESFKKAKLDNPIQFVSDGEELLDFLRGEGRYVDRSPEPLPGLILLDLNMPKMDGREALKQIKSDKRFQKIPVVVMTTSHAEEDIEQSYEAGANSYITKPLNFKDFLNAMLALNEYWFQIVTLPEVEP